MTTHRSTLQSPNHLLATLQAHMIAAAAQAAAAATKATVQLPLQDLLSEPLRGALYRQPFLQRRKQQSLEPAFFRPLRFQMLQHPPFVQNPDHGA
eukprot:3183625-Amphidinium_carterae.1